MSHSPSHSNGSRAHSNWDANKYRVSSYANSNGLVSIQEGVVDSLPVPNDVFYTYDDGSVVLVEPDYANYGSILPSYYVNKPYYDPEKRELVQNQQQNNLGSLPHANHGHGHGYEHGGGHGYFSPKPLSVFDIKTNPVEYLQTRLPLPVIPSPVRNVSRNMAPNVAPPEFVVPMRPAYHGGGADQYPNVPPPGSHYYGEDVVVLGNDGRRLVAEEVLDGNVAYCSMDIPSKELRQVREDLGAEMADLSRWGRGAGGGISMNLTKNGPRVESGTALQNGPVSVSTPLVNQGLYDQGFISMSGVPMIDAGKFKDPLTGVEYSAYESALPPPDADYEETLTAPARNVKLAHLQGGWTDNTPRPTKVELVEDDFHMQYDRSINTYGTYDPSRYVEIFERNNRFTRNDEHPDPDGPELVGVPANMDGNQNVKIRPLPYLPPTNRGKWGETTFRSGIDARVAVGNSEMAVDRTYTTFALTRLENTRQDGGGMEVTGNTSGPMDTQMGGGGRRDIMATQRSTTESTAPYVAPASYVRLNSNTGTAQYNAPTGDRGTVLVSAGDQYGGTYGATVEAGALTDQQMEPSMGYSGTFVMDLMQVGGGVQAGGPGGVSAEGSQLQNQLFQSTNSTSGVMTRDDQYGSYGGGGGGSGISAEGAQLQNQILQSTNSTSGVTAREDKYGSYGGGEGGGGSGMADGALFQTQTLESINSKSGLSTRADQYGSYGGDDSVGQNLQMSQMTEHAMSKSGVTFQRDDYGSYGGVENFAQKSTDQHVSHLNSKSGVLLRTDAYGSFGGEERAATVQPQLLQAQNSKSGLLMREDAYGSSGGGGGVGGDGYAQPSIPEVYSAQALTKRQNLLEVQAAFDTTYGNGTSQPTTSYRSRLNSRKGPLVDFLMPSGSLSGTDGTENGSQNYGQSTSLNSKKEAQYDSQWGFSPQVPTDPTVVYGLYNQTAEHLNSRPYGNMQHLVAPASYSFFMQQPEA